MVAEARHHVKECTRRLGRQSKAYLVEEKNVGVSNGTVGI